MIVEKLLNTKNIYYKELGSDLVISCLSAEHKDNTPSLRVDKDTGVMHCFSCGFKGDLLKYFNVELSREDKEVFALKKKIREINLQVQGVELPPNTLPVLKRSIRGIDKSLFNELGVFTHPLFGDRLCFPIKDSLGIIRYLVMRANDPQEKLRYMVYPSDHNSTMLYPQNIEAHKDSIIYVEGIFDMLSLRRSGLNNIQCLQGVALLSEKHAKRRLAYIDILGIRKVYLMLDNDEAGESATEKLEDLIRTHTSATPIRVSYKGNDPGDMPLERVMQTLKKLYKSEDEQ